MATVLVIGVGFFLSGHDLRVSQAVAYTQTAEEMELAASGGNSLRRVAFLGMALWGAALLVVGRRPLAIQPILAAAIVLLLSLTAISFVWADDPGCGTVTLGLSLMWPVRIDGANHCDEPFAHHGDSSHYRATGCLLLAS